MAIKDVLLLLFTLCVSLRIHNGFGSRTLFMEEDLELEQPLKLLAKPAVNTIKTKFGDIYDCVDIYKQPALDHPLLKNHTFDDFQMRPTSYPKGFKKLEPTKTDEPFTNMWLNGKGCPNGTVPIRKMTKDDLIRAKLAAAQMFSSNSHPLTGENPGYHYAIARTKDPTRKFRGTGMITSVYNPAPVREKQFSRGHMMLRNGPERINTGWMVNPSLYGDNTTRAFIYTLTGSSHCFNILCSGFVSVRADIPVDVVLTPSKSGGPINEGRFSIFQDQKNKNWYLLYPPDDEVIGFWPSRIFKNLNDHANYAEWGGAVYSPPDVESPPMGNGKDYIKKKLLDDAYCKNLMLNNEKYELKVVNDNETEIYTDIQDVYKAVDLGIHGAQHGHIMYFGGEGNYTGNY